MVSGLSLLDVIGNSPSAYDRDAPVDRQIRVANELVAACLDERRHIDALDVCGPTGKWRRLHVRETEAQMRQLHEQWLVPARELFDRVRAMRQEGLRIERFEELQDAIGHTRGLLMTTVADLERARQQVRRGEVVTLDLEEARRELRARAGR